MDVRTLLLGLRPETSKTHPLTRAGVADSRGPVRARGRLQEGTKIENIDTTNETDIARCRMDTKDPLGGEVLQVLRADLLSKKTSSEALRFHSYRD